jgi:hypothetical protein
MCEMPAEIDQIGYRCRKGYNKSSWLSGTPTERA